MMNKLKSLATERPFAFAFIVTFAFILMLILSSVLGALWPGEEPYGQPGGIVGRLISIALLLTVLSRLGWLRSAGFTWLGRWQTWLISLLSLTYSIAVSAYALTGNFDFNNADTILTGLITLFIVTAAFMEAVVFRGLILHAFVRVWGNTNRGLIRSALVSSLLFSSIHILDLLSGRPLPNVLLQSVQAFLLGAFLAALVLSGKSMYPAVIFHGLLNLAGYLSSNGLEPAPSAFVLLSLLILPLAVFGMYLILTISRRSPPMKTEFSKEFPNP
jgi:membrane protease YdiL (CAAX protease family)